MPAKLCGEGGEKRGKRVLFMWEAKSQNPRLSENVFFKAREFKGEKRRDARKRRKERERTLCRTMFNL
jgi:hypothetical protein